MNKKELKAKAMGLGINAEALNDLTNREIKILIGKEEDRIESLPVATEEQLQAIIDSDSEIIGADEESQEALEAMQGEDVDLEDALQSLPDHGFLISSEVAELHDIDITDGRAEAMRYALRFIETSKDVAKMDAEVAERMGTAAKTIPVKLPIFYKHAHANQFDIEELQVPSGESFTPNARQLLNKRFMKRFNYAISNGTLIKA